MPTTILKRELEDVYYFSSIFSKKSLYKFEMIRF